jgi:ketosteroid isomerase-like protein
MTILLALFLFLGAPPEAELTAKLHEFMAGASVNDAAIHDRFWAEDLIYTSSTGRRFGKAEIMAGFTTPPTPSTTTYTAEEIRIQVYGDMAIVAFRMRGVDRSASEPKTTFYLNSGTFVKRDGEWRVVNWQATRVPD